METFDPGNNHELANTDYPTARKNVAVGKPTIGVPAPTTQSITADPVLAEYDAWPHFCCSRFRRDPT